MKSLYNKIFKNNQVTYGRPFQVKIPINLQNIAAMMDDEEDTDDANEIQLETEKLLEKAKQESELILKEAELEADRLLEQARMEAENLMEEAWQKGYKEGTEAACSENESILAEADQIRISSEQEYKSILEGMETEIVELVLEVARKAVAGELAANRDVILQLIAEALSNCSNKNNAVLRVSPPDCDYLNDNREKLLTMVEGADELEIKKDNTLKAGECIIDTTFGSVAAGVNTRLDKIEEAFRKQLEVG